MVAGILLALAGCAAPSEPGAHPSGDVAQTTTTTTTITTSTPAPPASPTPAPTRNVSWHLDKNQTWVATGSPPDCPEPLTLATPVDLAQATAILYPGQPRGGAFKPHGGFRFDGRADNNVTVTIPFDALLVRGTHGMRNGQNISSMEGLEEQDSFEFIAPCGIMYTFGHLRHLAPKFQQIADGLPVIVGFAQQQYFDVDPPVRVAQGEVLATAIGFENGTNVFVDWGVLDLRHTNGATLRPEWSQYQNDFDKYAVCWLDLLPPDDARHARTLRGGDSVSGTQSDYCGAP